MAILFLRLLFNQIKLQFWVLGMILGSKVEFWVSNFQGTIPVFNLYYKKAQEIWN